MGMMKKDDVKNIIELIKIFENKVLMIPLMVLLITQVFKTIYFSIKNISKHHV